MGLRKIATTDEIREKNYSLTPGAYVGVVEVEDDGVDFNERKNEIHAELATLNAEARIHVASTANYELTMMYWHIGERINRVVLGNERADYGKQIVATVSRQLQAWYGSKGFEERTIRRMVQYAQEFPDWQIVSPLVSKLSWTHFLTIMTLKDPLQREFYLTMAANEKWSKRTLQSKIDGMLYERTALSSKPEEVVKQELAKYFINKLHPKSFLSNFWSAVHYFRRSFFFY